MQFWPAPAGPDRIIRQTTEIAAYWHRAHPGPALTDADRAERKRHKAGEKARRKLEARHAEDRLRWGDRVPSDRLRNAARRANPADELDADLVFALAELDDEACGAVARWAAGRAVAVAGLEQVPWAARALAAPDRGGPLPPPFRPPSGAEPADPGQVWELQDDAGPPMTTVVLPAVASGGRCWRSPGSMWRCRRCSPPRTGPRLAVARESVGSLKRAGRPRPPRPWCLLSSPAPHPPSPHPVGGRPRDGRNYERRAYSQFVAVPFGCT